MKHPSRKGETAADDLHQKFPQIRAAFHQVLAAHGVDQLAIKSVEFVHAPEVSAGNLPRALASMICVPTPDGGVQCFPAPQTAAAGSESE